MAIFFSRPLTLIINSFGMFSNVSPGRCGLAELQDLRETKLARYFRAARCAQKVHLYGKPQAPVVAVVCELLNGKRSKLRIREMREVQRALHARGEASAVAL